MQKTLKTKWTSFSLHPFCMFSSTRRSPLTIFRIAHAISLALWALLVANTSLEKYRSVWAVGNLPCHHTWQGWPIHWAPNSSTCHSHKISFLHLMPIQDIPKGFAWRYQEFVGVRKEGLVNALVKHTHHHPFGLGLLTFVLKKGLN